MQLGTAMVIYLYSISLKPATDHVEFSVLSDIGLNDFQDEWYGIGEEDYAAISIVCAISVPNPIYFDCLPYDLSENFGR